MTHSVSSGAGRQRLSVPRARHAAPGSRYAPIPVAMWSAADRHHADETFNHIPQARMLYTNNVEK